MLIDEIIQLLGDEKSNISAALLKTKILLHEIGKKDLVEWVNHELNGYKEEDILPKYRIVPSQVLANAANMRVRYSSHPIPIGHLKPEMQESLEKSRMFESLAILEQFVSASKSSTISRPLPMEMNGLLGQQLHDSFNIERAWCAISIHDVKGILMQVRSRLLDFLLELKGSIGESKTPSEFKEKISTVDSTGMFNHAIFGSNTTIVVGHNNNQTVHNVREGNLDTLTDTLTKLGLPPEEIQNLKGAIAEDIKENGKASYDGKTGSWFTRLLGKAAKGGISIGVEVVSGAISKALTTYMGG